MRGWRVEEGEGPLDGWWDGSSSAPDVVCRTENQNPMANNATHIQRLFTVTLFFFPFVLEKRGKTKKRKTPGFCFSTRRIPSTILSLPLTTSGLLSLSFPSLQLWLCSALVLPVLKPIGGCDHSQTPAPSQKTWGGRQQNGGFCGLDKKRSDSACGLHFFPLCFLRWVVFQNTCIFLYFFEYQHEWVFALWINNGFDVKCFGYLKNLREISVSNLCGIGKSWFLRKRMWQAKQKNHGCSALCTQKI